MRPADRYCCDGRCQHGGTCPALLSPGTIDGPYRPLRKALTRTVRLLGYALAFAVVTGLAVAAAWAGHWALDLILQLTRGGA